MSLGRIDIVWEADRVAAHVDIPPGVSLDMNDLAGTYYRKVTSIRLPKSSVCLLQHPPRRDQWIETGEVVLDGAVDIYSCPPQWRESARRQALFLQDQDSLTGRLRDITSQVQNPRFRKSTSRSIGFVYWPSSCLGYNVYVDKLKLPRRAPPIEASFRGHRRRRTSDSHNRPASFLPYGGVSDSE